MLKLAFVIEAVDKATSTVRKVNATIDRLTEPVRKVRASFNALLKESRFDRVAGAFGDLANRGRGFMDTARGVAGGLAMMGVAAAGIFYGLKRTADQVDALGDTARMLGMTTEQLSKMGYAAQLNGSSQEEMNDALRFLSRNMVAAVNGSKEARDWFARVGVPLERLKKLDAPAVFEAIADKFFQVGDEGQNAERKIAVMQALLGRSGSQLKQVLDLGSAGLRKFYQEAERVGAVIDTETADAMQDFNDNFDRMKFSLFGLVSLITRAALPAFNMLVEQVTKLSVANRDQLARSFGQLADRVVASLPRLLTSVEQIGSALWRLVSVADRVAQAIGGWQNVINLVVGIIGAKLLVSLGLLAKALWGVAAAFLATPFGLVVAGITAIVAAVAALIIHWEKVKEVMRGVFDYMVEGFHRLDRLMPDWFKRFTIPGAAMSGAINQFLPGGAAAAPAAPSAVAPAAGTQRTDVGGTLKIQIDQTTGRARVAELLSNTPSMDFEVFLGTQMVTP